MESYRPLDRDRFRGSHLADLESWKAAGEKQHRATWPHSRYRACGMESDQGGRIGFCLQRWDVSILGRPQQGLYCDGPARRRRFDGHLGRGWERSNGWAQGNIHRIPTSCGLLAVNQLLDISIFLFWLLPVFFFLFQDDNLIPISMHPMPTALAPSQQPLQTNQTTFTYSSEPRTLLVTTGDGSVKLLDYPSLTTVHALHAHTSACFCLELSPTGRYLAVGGSDALISLWDTTEWVCRRTLAGMVGAVKQVSFSWDGSYVVGGSDEGNGLEIVSSPPPCPPPRLPRTLQSAFSIFFLPICFHNISNQAFWEILS